MINASGQEFDGIGAQRTSWVADTYKVYNVNSSGDLYAVTDPNELNALNANANITCHTIKAESLLLNGWKTGLTYVYKH